MPVHRNGVVRSHGRPAFNLTTILLHIAPFYIPANSAGRLQFIVNIFTITLEFLCFYNGSYGEYGGLTVGDCHPPND